LIVAYVARDGYISVLILVPTKNGGNRAVVSEKQAEENRRNAQKSTGPATDNGKAVSALNAIKHGLTATNAVVVSQIEDAKAWERHHTATLKSLQPVGYFETILAERIAAQSWRLARAMRDETAMIQTEQETVEDDLNQRRRLFARGGIGETHPEDIRGRVQAAEAVQRALKKLPVRADSAPVKSGDAAAIVWLAFDVADVDIDVSLPGLPDDAELYELAEFDGFTAGQVQECVAAVATAAGIPLPELMERMHDRARLELVCARVKAEDTERELAHIRRQRTLPLAELNHEKLQRYETTLEWSLFRNLHELQRLQEKRAGGQVPAPVAIDVELSSASE
jgi:hypothetical protein